MIFEKIRERLKLATRDFLDGAGSITFETSAIPTNRALDIINQVEAEYNNGWIPCSERLPEPRRKILVLDTKKEIHITYYDDGNECFWGKGDIYMINATHWQPLPQPPKGE